MKIVYAALMSALVITSGAFAQSGRRVEAPAPTAVSNQERASDFSESVTAPKRPRAFSESTRRQAIANTNKTRKPQIKAAETVENPSASTVTATAAAGDEEVLRVETDLISIPVSVYDRNGLYIPNLRQSDFKVFEDGKEQAITYFGTSEQPFTVVLLIDTSPSTDYDIDEIRSAAIAFVDQLKPQDKVMVIEFDGNVHVLSEPTGDRNVIHRAIKRADFGGGTSLYDAVTFSLTKRMNLISGRKAIVLFTDGVDTQSSKSNYDSTLEIAEESDTLIFPIYYNTYGRTPIDPFWGPPPRGTTAAEYAVGRKYLEELAAYTGGRVFRPGSTPGGLAAAFEGIAEELRRQYNIGYSPDETGRPGQRKQIKVRVNRPNLVVRARDSYIVGTQKVVQPAGLGGR